jgi:hypothetical protein
MAKIVGILAKILVVATIAIKVLPPLIELLEKISTPTAPPENNGKDEGAE